MSPRLFLSQVYRRHVLSDVKPYVKTHPAVGNDMFENRATFMVHELQAYRGRMYHPSSAAPLSCNLAGLPENCMFCMKSTGKTARDYARHVGRHMEEIAFTVVPKQYEDWEFYSEDTYKASRHVIKRPFPDAL